MLITGCGANVKFFSNVIIRMLTRGVTICMAMQGFIHLNHMTLFKL
jgi:hypothetical protein